MRRWSGILNILRRRRQRDVARRRNGCDVDTGRRSDRRVNRRRRHANRRRRRRWRVVALRRAAGLAFWTIIERREQWRRLNSLRRRRIAKRRRAELVSNLFAPELERTTTTTTTHPRALPCFCEAATNAANRRSSGRESRRNFLDVSHRRSRGKATTALKAGRPPGSHSTMLYSVIYLFALISSADAAARCMAVRMMGSPFDGVGRPDSHQGLRRASGGGSRRPRGDGRRGPRRQGERRCRLRVDHLWHRQRPE